MFVSRYPEQIPPEAVRPALAERCCRCIATPLTVLWKVIVRTSDAPTVWPKVRADVLEIQLCGHDANLREDAMDADGWIIVLDRRQAAIRHETPS
jgi:hypothetical protein